MINVFTGRSQNVKKSLFTSSIIHGKSRVYFSKVTIDVLIVGGARFRLNNLNNKANESRVRGNTRECGQTLKVPRSMYSSNDIFINFLNKKKESNFSFKTNV